ncbi:MAG TPA: SusC/RagA family TonB-linked outer membrane protein [Longimicrobiaceae bacterium]|nr:SusC/RagA family TonB-linked outer membrane protein [Longimicrobiaceae bacterium]
MKKLLVLTTACLVLGTGEVWAQNRTVSGQVTSSDGRPLAGVIVAVKGTNVRAVTDANGRYTIEVPATGQQLVFSGQSVASREAAISGNTVNVTLASQAVALEGLVVTALGITQREKTIGTSVQSVRGEELTRAPEANFVSALSGKVAGVSVTNTSTQGGSSRIVIRGAASISGNNQPLFVVDGVPVDNSAPRLNGFTGTGKTQGAVDYGNAAADINPNDIESISVLKGPNAAALYGARAANGAIIITTKSGRNARGLGITANSNVTFETPLVLPSYQNQYGQGYGGEFDYVNGRGGGRNDGVDESWGPPCDGRPIRQFFSEGQPVPFVCYEDNVSSFFETGRTITNSVALSASSDRVNGRLSVTDVRTDGMYPGMELGRLTTAFNGGLRLTDRLSADAAVQYVRNEGLNRPGVGYQGTNPMQQFVWYGRTVDTKLLRNHRNQDGSQFNWNYNYHNNPYWLALENRNEDDRDRVIGNISLNYNLTDWLTANVRSGTDVYSEFRQRGYTQGLVGVPYAVQGGLHEQDRYHQETNTSFLLSANRNLTSDFSLSANVGGNRRFSVDRDSYRGTNRLTVDRLYNIGNSAITPTLSDSTLEKQINSLYGQAQFGFRNYLFVELTGRNDWSSTLPQGNNSYFYPSVSGSFVFSDAFPSLLSGILSFGKIRAGWARVGNDADPYQLASTYITGTAWSGAPAYSYPNRLANAELKPEETTSIEAGTELRFLEDRLGLDLTVYQSQTVNQILPVQVSTTSGFNERVLNAGQISNRGMELAATVIPVRLSNGFEWEMRANYARNKNKVDELYGDLQTLVLGSYWGLNVEARRGEPYGVLFGNSFKRDAAGNVVVGANGLPIWGPRQVLGKADPDWTAGLTNTIRYGGLDVSVLVDAKQGGSVFSVTNMFGAYAGIIPETVEGRCGGPNLPPCSTNGLLINGVTESGQPNTVRVNPQDYWQYLFQLHEPFVYDASFVKLREVRLGYTVPGRFTNRLGVSGLSLAVVGRNLALWTDMPHIDPETSFDASNVQGLEFGQLPSTRSFGINVSVTP